MISKLINRFTSKVNVLDSQHNTYTQDDKTIFEYTVVGLEYRPLADLYYFLIAARWHWLISVALGGYIVINLIFALLFWLDKDAILNARPGSFADAFFFSIQSFSTIGYGGMSPNTLYAHLLVTVESFAGLVAVAMGTGLIFAKFSRPSARVAFSNIMVMCDRDGVPTLQFRIANERQNEILNANLHVSVLVEEVTAEGQRMRRFRKLALEQEESPMFTINWTAIHRLDDTSPLYGLGVENVKEEVRFIIAVFSGLDGTFLQTVQARHVYQAEDIAFGCHFEDMVEMLPSGDILLDHGQLNYIKPV